MPRSAADVALCCHPLATLTVRLVGQRVYAACIHPAVVEVEQCADCDGEICRFVVPTGSVEFLDVLRLYFDFRTIHLLHKAEEGLMLVIQCGGFKFFKYVQNQLLTTSSSAATAACAFSQNGQRFRSDVKAAMSSRIPG